MKNLFSFFETSLSCRINRLTGFSARLFIVAGLLSCFVNVKAQCLRTIPFSETWSGTSFTTGCWSMQNTLGHIDAGSVQEEANSINCSPTPCEGGAFPDLSFLGNQC